MIAPAMISAVRACEALLLDSNLLVLHVVGRLGAERLASFKRTQQFEWSDFEALEETTKVAKRLVTTPHVLAETSNFLGQLPGREPLTARGLLLQQVALLSEHWEAVEHAVGDSHVFARLGIADWALLRLAQQGTLILSDDAILCDWIGRLGFDNAINFRHLRPLDE